MTRQQERTAGPVGTSCVPPETAVHYEVRELTSEAEYLDCFRLRHSVYAPLGYQREGAGTGIELDEFDLRARLLGAYEGATGTLAATIRLIPAAPQPGRGHLTRRHERLIRQILASYGDAGLTAQVMQAPEYPLPSILSDRVMRLVEACNTRGDALHELSRSIVRPGRRGQGLARVMTEFGLALAAPDGPATLIGGCVPEHVPMYGRYGFGPVPGTGPESFDAVGQLGYVVIGRTDELGPETQVHVDGLRDAMRSGAGSFTLQTGPQEWARCRFPAA